MNAIIILLNAIFAKLTTAVNKAYTKSQRGSIVFYQDDNTFDDGADILSSTNKNTSNQTLLQQIDALQRGDGDYLVKVQMPEGGEGYVYSDGTGHDSTIVVRKTGSSLTFVGKTSGFNRLLTVIYARINTAKSEAITAAAADATTKATDARIQAVGIAAADATTKANSALNAAKADTLQKVQFAVTAAAADATTKADAAKSDANSYTDESVYNATVSLSNYTDTAKGQAIDSAKTYTDAEIAKLQLYAQKGIKNLGRFVHQLAAGPTANLGNLGTLPSAVAFGFTEVGYYVVEVEATDANGKAIFDKEGLLEVATGVDANGNAILSTITVSTEDELMVEVVLIDGVPFLKYVKKHDVRILEMFNDLSTKIETQVSETELNNALIDVKAYVDAQINAALV